METPGTAPGSDPLITSAFMSIVPKDTLYIGLALNGRKGVYAKRTQPVHILYVQPARYEKTPMFNYYSDALRLTPTGGNKSFTINKAIARTSS